MKSWSSNDYNKDNRALKMGKARHVTRILLRFLSLSLLLLLPHSLFCLVFVRFFSLLFISFIFSISSVHTLFRFVSSSLALALSRDKYMIFAFCLFFEMLLDFLCLWVFCICAHYAHTYIPQCWDQPQKYFIWSGKKIEFMQYRTIYGI